MSKDRILWLDSLNVMAIYLVVLGHIVSTTYQPDLKGIIYSFHMPLFFMISGYLNKDKHNAIKANVFALIVPYVLLCILYFPFYALYHRHEDYLVDYALLLITGKAAWFIPALFIMKVIYIPFVRNYKLWTSFVLILISLTIAYILYQNIHTFDYHIFRFFPFFILGYIIKKENVNIKCESTLKSGFV